jgi:LysW-gamma-L-lysine carboxypeptidase
MDEVSLLESLLQHYSPTGGEAEAVRYLVAQMEALGYAATIDDAGNAVGVIGDGPDAIVLLGHIDTVSGFIEVKREGDALWGRGAVDAKGPLACFVAAGARAGAKAGQRIVVIGAVGEEGDSPGAKFVRDRYRPSALIIGEPSGWDRVTLGYKGSAWFEYTVRRTLAHTATQAESACEAAVAFWNRVVARTADFSDGQSRMFDRLIPTLRKMRSNSDGFSETAQLKIGLRLPLGLSVPQATAMVTELADSANVTLLDGIEAYRAEKNTPLVRAFLAAIRAEGGTPRFTLKSGTSDMNVVAPTWGCPALAYGPGDSDLDHTPDEHILIPDYLRAIDILTEVLRTI